MYTWQKLKKNRALFQNYFIKEFLIKSTRKFFEQRNYHELESPILAPMLPQERYINPVEVNFEIKNSSVKNGYIIPTTERYNKLALAAGLGAHFTIAKVARATEELSPNHNIEFTMLEWYHINANYTNLMFDCENLIRFCLKHIETRLKEEKKLKNFPINPKAFSVQKNVLTNQKYRIDFSGSWERISVVEALKNFCQINLEDIQTEKDFSEKMKNKGYSVDESDSWQIMFELLFANEIEPNLSKTKPTFIFDFPLQVCVLTKPSPRNPMVCERVELYIAGVEIANGYTELTDANTLKENFDREQKQRSNLKLKPVNYDYELLKAVELGLPNVAGMGMGLDRLAMILAGIKQISDINFFPANEWE